MVGDRSRQMKLKFVPLGTSAMDNPLNCLAPVTLGARDFSSAVSGFCQVFIEVFLAASAYGRRPTNTENSRRTREKPLVPMGRLQSLYHTETSRLWDIYFWRLSNISAKSGTFGKELNPRSPRIFPTTRLN